MAQEGGVHPAQEGLVGNGERRPVLALLRPGAGISSGDCQTVTGPLTQSIRRRYRDNHVRRSITVELAVGVTHRTAISEATAPAEHTP